MIQEDLKKVLMKGLIKLSRVKEKYTSFCENYLHCENLREPDIQKILQTLAEHLIDIQSTVDIVNCFPQILLYLLYEAIPLNFCNDSILTPESMEIKHKINCVVLGNIVTVHPDALSFAQQYFVTNPSPFAKKEFESKLLTHEIPAKKFKVVEDPKIFISDLDIVNCSYNFIKIMNEFVRSKWNWSEFIQQYLGHEDDLVRWLCCQCLSILTGMSEYQLDKLLNHIVPKAKEQCLIDYINYCQNKQFVKSTDSNDINTETTETISYNFEYLNSLSGYIATVSGILLPVFDEKSVQRSDIVQVESTQRNLKKIALAIASNKSVCIQGPVGSGKTALVEHLALLTGRKLGDNFVKVQLGDQTDSKMLLGTYRCTDVPGEFVWQPGVLTQAVMYGYWILLEDIDSSSMDVITVIASLLENNALSVPGYRDVVKTAPGFQLFVTQRLLPSVSGYRKQNSYSSSLIEKKLMLVNMEPLTPSELIDIVQTSFKDLKTIASRLVDVYLLFSSGMHYGDESNLINIANDTSDSDRVSKDSGIDTVIPHKSSFVTGRLISTRDLIKFCTRAIVDFDITSSDSALKVFQDAIDIFCCSFNSADIRLKLACKIAIKLGIIETKAEYFCVQYKPGVSFSRNTKSGLFTAGRVTLEGQDSIKSLSKTVSKFSFTRPSACLLERIACCVKYNEPVLLVGETGVGKTSAIQYLANSLNQKLIVINMNQQSDSADLLGGFKPVDLKFVMLPVRKEFEELFRKYFDVQQNVKFLEHISTCFNTGKFSALLKLMKHSQLAAVKRLNTELNVKSLKKANEKAVKKKYSERNVKSEQELLNETDLLLNAWLDLGIKLDKLSTHIKMQATLAFAFIEGSLVKAIEKGYWVLLDEINLATAETLECLSGLLEGVNGSLSLLERGDKKPIQRHKNFTLFACMNPATDVGKKDLPAGLRNRFTEFFVEELTEKADLHLLVNSYLKDLTLPQNKIDNIVKFYLKIRKQAVISLTDGTGHKPHYSLRTLCRALSVAMQNQCGTIQRSLYEAFCLSFLTQLNAKSHMEVESMIAKAVIGSPKEVNAVLKQPILEPKSNDQEFIQFEGYWVTRGALEPEIVKDYILTTSVKKNLKDLARIVSIGKHPVLLQGDTSVGKTSLITYLAKASGNRCVRINNHEHTDLQEYVGSYIADETGKLVFKEGVLVEAMRKGHWIILDELNLAPSDVLEALNRVLDDNRELFIPETQETVKANKNFMLFATQNPPGLYGGRKVLSRAFRNRFVELHFDEIPLLELEVILHQRCEIPQSYCKKMIAVMNDLQLRRRGSAAFAGKQGFITLRDLFRWGERYHFANVEEAKTKLYDWDQHIADEGYLVLAGRVRREEERIEIANVLKKHIKRDVDHLKLFTLNEHTSRVTKHILQTIEQNSKNFPHIVWTLNMRKLAVMVSKALEFNEPVLLVGSTGGGKTTVCQLIAESCKQKLYTVNCHMHTESSDFVGGLRPVRCHTSETDCRLFEWVDGPLIQAMVNGGLFLADEISLADDSVIERLNSLLEPERSILLAEKGTNVSSENVIVADKKFNFVSTMNPGGDFGKKELSPALRNRFTEIWCDSVMIREDMVSIIEHNITKGFSFGNQEDGTTGIGKCIMDFVEFFKNTDIGCRFTISIRDVLTWIHFINKCTENSFKLDVSEAYIHGACLTFLDSLGSGVSCHETELNLKSFRDICINFLNKQLEKFSINTSRWDKKERIFEVNENVVGIRPFYIQRGKFLLNDFNFCFETPTVGYNAMRLLRGLQLNKAILLEGSPGVGKTSLVTALAQASGHKVLRINLSDQTDISDLFGSDLPVEGGRGGEFSWRDGPFLRALKQGSWILLDELNLASQSVLEGLNACLDHRGEVYIPELDKTFNIKPGTQIFACQNPLKQGGSRKGLPQSFLNRFTQVFISPLTDLDLESIVTESYKSIPHDILKKMLKFNQRIVSDTVEKHLFGYKGGPWEFNLRDVQRWCDGLLHLIKEHESNVDSPDFDNKDDADKIIQYWTDKFNVQVDERKIREAKSREVRRLLASKSYEHDSDFEEVSEDEEIQSQIESVDRLNSKEEDVYMTSINDENVNIGDEVIKRSSTLLISQESLSANKNVNPGKLVRLIYSDRMRTKDDKQKILEIYEEIFGEKMFKELPETEPFFYVTPFNLYIGDVSYERSHSKCNNKTNEVEVKISDINVSVLRQNQCGSLILRTQLNALKSLLLCVKLNWMAILVGGPSSGKSSVVQTLATLTGHELKTLSVNSAMDTTDILGGFEQTDYNRHLEEIAGKIERTLLAVVQQCLITLHDKETASKLLNRWENYKDLCQSPTFRRTASEETDYFKEKLKELRNILTSMKVNALINILEWDYLINRLDSLNEAIKKENNLNSGGKFEWVDSVLIKCLQNGTWLLIDNVNMCSPAVLDRLNALLEPNGVLTIGERGVNEQGEMTEIRPHPNFRLFLAMDPKNGEISRAMRNRGVEICMLNNSDEDDNFLYDLKSILYEAGLKDTTFQNIVLNLHRMISEMIIGDKPSTAQIAQAGFILSQQLVRGLNTFSAILSTISDIYIKNYCFKENCKTAVTSTISDYIKEELKHKNNTIEMNMNSRDLSLNTLNMQSNSNYEFLKQRSAILVTCLKTLTEPQVYLKHDISTSVMTREIIVNEMMFSKNEKHDSNYDKIEKVIVYFMVHLFHTASIENFKMSNVYLENSLNKILSDCVTNSSVNKLFKIINMISLNATVIKQKYASVEYHERQYLPMDLRWFPETIHKFYKQKSKVELTINPFILLIYFIASTTIQNDTPTLGKTDKKKQYTVYEYSELVKQKKISSKIVENTLINNFTLLIETFDEFLTRILLLNKTVIRDEDFVELLSTLMWRHRLCQQGQLNLLKYNKNKPAVDISSITTLTIHFRWFKKWTLPKLVKIVQLNKSFDEYYQPFETILREVDLSLMDMSSPIKKISKNFLRYYGQPLPYSNVTEVQTNQKYQQIVDEITIINAHNNFKRYKKTVSFLTSSKGHEIRRNLIENKISETLTIDLLDEMCVQLRDGIENSSTDNSSDIELYPIREYIAMLLMIFNKKYLHTCNYIDNVTDYTDNDSEIVNHTSNVLKSVVTIPIDLTTLYSTYLTSSNDEHTKKVIQNKLNSLIAQTLVNSAIIYSDNYIIKMNCDNEQIENNVILSFQHPLLINTILKHAIHENTPEILSTTSLGVHKQKTMQLSELNDILWKNSLALASNKYDYVYNEMQSALHNYMTFLNSLIMALESKNQNKITRSSVLSITYTCINDIFERFVNYENNEATKNQCKTLCISLEKCNHLVKKLLRLETTLLKKIEVVDGQTDNTDMDFIDDRGLINLSYKVLYISANITAITNYMKTILTSEMPLIDPVHKRSLKLRYCTEEQKEIEIISNVYNTQSSILNAAEGVVRHPFYKLFNETLVKLQNKKHKLQQYVAVRPENSLFDELLKDITSNAVLINDIINMILPNLNGVIEKLLNSSKQNCKFIEVEQGNDALNQSRNWMFSQKRFCAKLASKYLAWYPDLIEPVLNSFGELSYGIDQLNCLLNKLMRQNELLHEHNSCSAVTDINNLLIDLVQFPNCKIDTNINEFSVNLVSKILADNEAIAKHEILRLLKCSLQDMWNNFTIRRRITSQEEWKRFDQIIKGIVASWRQQEDEKSKKTLEEDSLYQNKPRCETKSDEELMNEEMKEMFPDYHGDDFTDIIDSADSLNRCRETPQTDVDNSEEPIIGPDDIEYIYKIHSATVKYYAEAEWLNENKNHLKRNLILPLIQKYNTFNLIFDKVITALDYQLDLQLLPSLNFIVSYTKFIGEGESKFEGVSTVNTPSKIKHTRSNFYTDPNIDEVKTCYHIIKTLENRINELLNEWPNHPTLESISMIIQRVLNFKISSPVFRFLTGMELLLTKCNEWEENAHSGVSLAMYIQEVTQQIITWRKLELSMWKNCLDYAVDKVHKKAARWWFHIYSIMDQYIHNKAEKMPTKDLITSVQQFIEKSNLGEFNVRLNLLYTFHCHVLFLEKNKRADKFRNVMWNLYNYYKQFQVSVENQIKVERNPIEKKIKDYVKIVRWNDINYWSVKETVTKTHRTLHKHIKQFEDVLKQPITKCLSNVKLSNNDKEQVGIWDRPQRHLPSTHHYVIEPNSYISSLKLKRFFPPTTTASRSNDTAVLNYEHLFNKSRNLTKKIIVSTTYSKLIQTMDSFVTNVIETSSHLQNLEVDKSLPQTKQKSQAKNILQQKRKALSDLYKNLQQLGLSYRTGIVESKIQNNTITDFVMNPINLSASLSYLKNKKCDGYLLTVWDGCETYYQRSIARLAALNVALQNPSPDLGIMNIERFKGFSTNLMTTVQKQKLHVIECTSHLYYLRSYLSHALDMFEDDNSYFPHKEDLRKNTEISKGIHILITQILNFLEQLKIYMLACPDVPDFNEEIKNVPVLNPKLSQSFILNKSDEKYKDIMINIQYIIDVTTKLNLYLEKSENFVPSTENTGFVFQKHLTDESFIELNTELEDISTFLRYILNVFVNDNTFHPICKHIHTLLFDIKEKRAEMEILSDKVFDFKVKSDEHSNEDVLIPSTQLKLFENRIENLTTKLLLMIQNVYKKHCLSDGITANISTEEVLNEEEIEEFMLKENHLKSEILESLYNDLEQFDTQKVIKEFRTIISEYKNVVTDFSEMKWCQSKIKKCFPLMEQVILLYQYFVIHQISTYRITCKLSSILFNIFIDISSKGFCIPPEFSDETTQGGRQESQSGMGLGDGEGEKDISDQIETEDQLEEAKRQEEYEKEKEDPQCKEEKGGIEMSDDFEGQLQDLEKDSDDESEQSDNDSDAEKQMGDTERNTDKLDQQIWGDDKENSDDEEEHSDTDGEGGDGNEDNENARNNEKEGDGKADGDTLGAKNENKDEENKTDKEDSLNQNEPTQQKEPVKDINELNEPEYDEEQVNPYHGKHEPRPEPEPFDLPDDLQLDDGEQKQNEDEIEENPFDIDKMKEQQINNDDTTEPEQKEDKNENDNTSTISENEDDEDETNKKGDVENICEESDPIQDENKADEGKKENDDETKEEDIPNKDLSEITDDKPTNEDQVEAMEIDTQDASMDNAQPVSEQQNFSKPNENFNEKQNAEDKGVGQAENEQCDEGHLGDVQITNDNVKTDHEKESKKESKKKIGESDSKRSLGDVSESVKKKLKTMDTIEETEENVEKENAENNESEIYQHITDATEHDSQIMDAATDEQAEKQQIPNINEEETAENLEDSDVEILDDSKPEMSDADKPEKISADQTDTKKSQDKKSDAQGENLQEITETKMDVEGDIVDTVTVMRGNETTYHTQFDNINYNSEESQMNMQLSLLQIDEMRKLLEDQLSNWQEPPTNQEAERVWDLFSSLTSNLARDLSEQLRLVLEPTQTSHLKGDYRTGRRINMRKVIPYIASQFRKDKIWLRRTKPSKRDYQIVLAIDDSQSMADNHSKELAFESLALISSALTLLETGQLSVLSFGEDTEILHRLSDQFTEQSGSRLLQKFTFEQKKTCIAKLVNFTCQMFEMSIGNVSSSNAKLLIIVSDGRGVFSEGEIMIQQAVRRAKFQNIFMVFVIIDNPENKDSVLDIRMPMFKDGQLLGIKSYLDNFPFPFYLILRDINQLPNVLSDALRQWFELVSDSSI